MVTDLMGVLGMVPVATTAVVAAFFTVGMPAMLVMGAPSKGRPGKRRRGPKA